MSDLPTSSLSPADLAQVLKHNLKACGLLARAGGFEATLLAIDLVNEALSLDLARAGGEGVSTTTDTTD
jgi:hypothetical protein